MPDKDPCLAAINKFWDLSRKKNDWSGCAESLHMWVKYLSVSGQIPAEYNGTARKRIALLEKKLISLKFTLAKKVIDAIKYARKRLNTSDTGPVRAGKFKTAVSNTDRDRITRTLDTGFLTHLKRPAVAYSVPDDDLDELRSHNRGPDGPELE